MLVQIYENWNGTFGMEEDDKNRSIYLNVVAH